MRKFQNSSIRSIPEKLVGIYSTSWPKKTKWVIKENNYMNVGLNGCHTNKWRDFERIKQLTAA